MLKMRAVNMARPYTQVYGRLPYVNWGALADTANSIYEQEVTGNPPAED